MYDTCECTHAHTYTSVMHDSIRFFHTKSFKFYVFIPTFILIPLSLLLLKQYPFYYILHKYCYFFTTSTSLLPIFLSIFFSFSFPSLSLSLPPSIPLPLSPILFVSLSLSLSLSLTSSLTLFLNFSLSLSQSLSLIPLDFSFPPHFDFQFLLVSHTQIHPRTDEIERYESYPRSRYT